MACGRRRLLNLRWARRGGDFIREQIGIYDAEYIIWCGKGVSDLTTSIIFGGSPDWRTTERGVWFVELPTGGHLIDYWHPQYRVAANLIWLPSCGCNPGDRSRGTRLGRAIRQIFRLQRGGTAGRHPGPKESPSKTVTAI